MIDVIANNDNVIPYIHLPLQSGSSRILKLMGRRYTKEEYLELYKKIREKVKDCSITTDIIVGFPNETEEQFQDTLDVVNVCKFDSAFTFIFSPREGTPAAQIDDKVDLKTKEDRLHRLNELINKYSLEANQRYLDKTVKVLIEGPSEKDPNKVFGYTETMKLVNVENAKDKIGEIVDVKITDAKSFSLDGTLV
jgi:tRNA-2-methylthio-N6-dimethylallyladenosine synthase